MSDDDKVSFVVPTPTDAEPVVVGVVTLVGDFGRGRYAMSLMSDGTVRWEPKL